MVNKAVFRTKRGPDTDSVNKAGANAYGFSPKAALAQYAVTGCFNDTFYADAEEQVKEVLALAERCEPAFVAKAAVYGRTKAHMKDAPVFLLASIARRDPTTMERAFPLVVDGGKMARNFAQVFRSGAFGYKSIPRPARRALRKWFDRAKPDYLFRQSVGNEPSLADLIRMVHPKPNTEEKRTLYRYLIGNDADGVAGLAAAFEAWKKAPEGDPPPVPFLMLAGISDLSKAAWKAIARSASWTETRMNLNAFERHGCFEDKAIVDAVAARLKDHDQIQRARAFPYQMMMAYLMTEGVPAKVRAALQDAMEVATENTPDTLGRVVAFVDTSGSMRTPVTGSRKGASSKVLCSEAAALSAACILRRNPESVVIPFNVNAFKVDLNPRDSVTTIAQKIACVPNGGTNLSCAMAAAVEHHPNADLLVYFSDNESWIDGGLVGSGSTPGSRTETMRLWDKYRRGSPKARLVCVDMAPNATSQAKERKDILNIGGFSDAIWPVIERFAKTDGTHDTFEAVIESVSLDARAEAL